MATRLEELDDGGLYSHLAAVRGELTRRGLPIGVGGIAERLAIAHYNSTPGLPNLQKSSSGTKNVDALSRRGDRYSIKGVASARKTGTVYPDPESPNQQLFEYILVVRLDESLNLAGIFEFDWNLFVKCRNWDKRMNAWYLGISKKTLGQARAVFESEAW